MKKLNILVFIGILVAGVVTRLEYISYAAKNATGKTGNTPVPVDVLDVQQQTSKPGPYELPVMVKGPTSHTSFSERLKVADKIGEVYVMETSPVQKQDRWLVAITTCATATWFKPTGTDGASPQLVEVESQAFKAERNTPVILYEDDEGRFIVSV